MSQTIADQPMGPNRDGGLGWMVALSAGLHVLAVVLAVVLPWTFRDERPKVVSYTVDLVAPDRIGGTNIPGKAKPAPLAKAQPPPAAPPKAPEPVKQKAPPQPAKKEPPPQPVKKEAAPKPEKKPPPKPVAKPKEPAKKEPVKVSAKKAEQPKPAAKEKAKAPEKKPAAEKAAKEPPKPAPAAKAETAAELSPEEAREAIAARLREERIAAAIARAGDRVKEEEDAEGPGTGSGPASYGPGEGAGGGILKGLDWIMYKNRVETMIRENWVWTGADRSLEATVRFGITEAGEVINFQVEKPSGDPSYDASIERAIKGVSPLPPPPEAYREEFSQYELTFNAEFLQM